MLAAQNQFPAQGENTFRLWVAALSLLDFQLLINQFGDPEPIDHLFDQDNACVRSKGDVSVADVEFPGFADYRFIIHLIGDSFLINEVFFHPAYLAGFGVTFHLFQRT